MARDHEYCALRAISTSNCFSSGCCYCTRCIPCMGCYLHWHFDPILLHLIKTSRRYVWRLRFEWVCRLLPLRNNVIARRLKRALNKMATCWWQQASVAPYTSTPIRRKHISSPQMGFISQSECGQRFMPSFAVRIAQKYTKNSWIYLLSLHYR